MRNIRKWAADSAPIAFVVGACFVFPVGGVAFSIATGVAGSVVTRPTEHALNWCRKRVTGGGLPLNHDLQAALRRSYVGAVIHLESVWMKSHQREGRLASQDLVSALFTMLREDIDDILSERRLKAFVDNSEAIQELGRDGEGAGCLTVFLEPYLYGHDEQLSRFLTQSLEPNLSYFFAEELKKDTSAWRAFQRLVVDSLHEGFRDVQRAQQMAVEYDQRILERLDAISQRLDTMPTDVRLADGYAGLDKAIADARDQVIDAVVAEGKLTRDAVLESYVALSSQIADLDDAVRAGFDRIHQRLESVIEAATDPAASRANSASRRAPVFNVPRRNPYFFGRDEELSSVAATVDESDGRDVRVQVLHGLGGVGKTQMATEFAHRYRNRYAGVWWVNADGAAAVSADMARLAAKLDLPASNIDDPQLAADAARRFLEATEDADDRWLIIFDNAHSPDDLDGFIPQSGNVDVIITSRSRAWDGEFSDMPLDVLSLDEARDFLLRRTKDADEESALALAKELGRLPLALEQAAAYIVALPVRNLRGYLAQVRDDPARALERGKPGTGGYRETVVRTWAISFRAVEAESPAAADLLRLLAFFAPDAIPIDIIAAHASLLPEPLQSALADSGLDVLEVAYRYSLLGIDAEGRASMHRLVQVVTRDQLSDDDRREWVRRALNIVQNALPEDASEHQNWPIVTLLRSHAMAVTEQGLRLNLDLETAASIRDRLGRFMASQANYSVARDLHEEVLALRQRVLPTEHPDISTSKSNLGRVLAQMGDYSAARRLHEEALRVRQQVLPTGHPDIAVSLNSLGFVLGRQGNFTGAQALYEEALALRRRVLPPDHPDIAKSLNNLAFLLSSQGSLAEAWDLHGEALAIRRRVMPRDHPSIATSLNNLALILASRGDYAGARGFHEEALAIRRRTLPADHPSIAISLGNLGRVLANQGDYAGAQELIKEALAIRRRILPADHPSTARSLNHLGRVLANQGDFAGARNVHEEALEIRRRALPAKHPDTLETLEDLASVLRQLGEYDLAVAYEEEAAALRTPTDEDGDSH